jgi:hypothetical protein
MQKIFLASDVVVMIMTYDCGVDMFSNERKKLSMLDV